MAYENHDEEYDEDGGTGTRTADEYDIDIERRDGNFIAVIHVQPNGAGAEALEGAIDEALDEEDEILVRCGDTDEHQTIRRGDAYDGTEIALRLTGIEADEPA